MACYRWPLLLPLPLTAIITKRYLHHILSTIRYAYLLFRSMQLWNVMAHAQKPDFVFRRNGAVHLNRLGRQVSRLLAAEVCASAVVMLDTPCSEVEWRVLATHSIIQFPLHFPSHASPCAITFQLESMTREHYWCACPRWPVRRSMTV